MVLSLCCITTFCAFIFPEIFLILVDDDDFVLLPQWPGCELMKSRLELYA